jgi:hypothetical protein
MFCFGAMIVVGLGNRITNIVMYNYISNYPLFVNQRACRGHLRRWWLWSRLGLAAERRGRCSVAHSRPRLPRLPRPPAVTTFAYIPTSLLYVIPMAAYRPDVITPEARAIPQKGASP